MAQFTCTTVDNAYLYTPDGGMSGNGAWHGGWGGGFEEPYFHFPAVAWNPATPVTSAFLTCVCGNNDIDHPGAVVKSSIYGDKQLAPTVPADDVDYNGRTRTAASIALWNVGTPPNPGVLVVSPDIGAIVAELVGQAGWTSGDDLGFLLPDAGSDVFTDFFWSNDPSHTVTLYINEAPPGPPTITSLTPNHGDHGSTVIITGTSLSAPSAVTIADLPMASYVVDSPTQITAVLPELARTGPISVATGTGTAFSAGDFTVPPSVQISARVNDLADGMLSETPPAPCLVKLTETVALLLHAGPAVESSVGGTFFGHADHHEARVKALDVTSTIAAGPSAYLDAASTSSTGNVLSADDATLATSTGNWAAGPSVTISRVTTPTPHAGPGDLKIVYTSNPGFVDGPALGGGIYSATAGEVVTLSCWVRSDPANTHPAAWVTLRWFQGIIGGRAAAQPISSGWTQLEAVFIAQTTGGIIFEIDGSLDAFGSSPLPAASDTFYASDMSISRQTGPNGVARLTGGRLDDTHALAVYQDMGGQVWAVVVGCADPTVPPTVGARYPLPGVTFISASTGQPIGCELLGLTSTWAAAHFANFKGYSIITDGATTIISATTIDRSYPDIAIPIGTVLLDTGEYLLVENVSAPFSFNWSECWFTAVSFTSPPSVNFHPSGTNPAVVTTGSLPFGQSLPHSDGWAVAPGAFRQFASPQGVIHTGHYDTGIDSIDVTAATTDIDISQVGVAVPLVASFDGGASAFAVLFVNSSPQVLMRAETVNPAGDTLSPGNVSAMPGDLGLPLYFAEHFVLSLSGRALAVLPGTGELVDGFILTPVVAAAPPTITSFSPLSGVPGTVITVIGSGFTDATDITIGGNHVAFTVISDGALSFNAGNNLGFITVTNPEGTAISAVPFTRLRTARASSARLKRI